jgi:crotonobetainyl-CoA:carnitine CoA-transferase CaiB-like acyl-CoA transferase
MSLTLSGLRVLDLTRALAGPFCTMALADLGAEVVKAEPTPSGDMARQWGPIDRDISVYYLSANRNKKGIGIDFRSAEGLALLRQLALKSDIVVENFRTGTMEKMGLGYESLARENPKLIMASISGFGNKGPAKDWAGFDQIAQGYSGFMSLTGTPETGPTRVGVPIGDLTAGMWLTIGILAAIVERGRTGRGQHVETSLLAGLMSLLCVQGQRYLNLGEVPEPCGNAHPVIAPYGTFETADGPLNLAPATEAMWVKLCSLLGASQLVDDPRFLTNVERRKNGDALTQELEARLREKTREEWTAIMIENGIPAGPINRMDDVFNDAQVAACNLVQTVEHSVLGAIKLVALPVQMGSAGDAPTVRSAPPLFGEHSQSILADYGFSSDEIQRLLDSKVIRQAKVGAEKQDA